MKLSELLYKYKDNSYLKLFLNEALKSPNLYAEIPQKVTISGDGVFKGVIKVEFIRVGPNPMTGGVIRRGD